MTSVSSSTTAMVTASSKPWFLTFDPQSKDVLIWKNGLRLKLRDGTTSGRITGVSVLSAVARKYGYGKYVYNECNYQLDAKLLYSAACSISFHSAMQSTVMNDLVCTFLLLPILSCFSMKLSVVN